MPLKVEQVRILVEGISCQELQCIYFYMTQFLIRAHIPALDKRDIKSIQVPFNPLFFRVHLICRYLCGAFGWCWGTPY